MRSVKVRAMIDVPLSVVSLFPVLTVACASEVAA